LNDGSGRVKKKMPDVVGGGMELHLIEIFIEAAEFIDQEIQRLSSLGSI
jgi:hypothetical protein